MNIHEYQAKEVLASFGVVVPPGKAVSTAEEAKQVAENLASEGHAKFVIKSQIHAGGRGKGTFTNGFKGGVKLCDTADQASEIAGQMLGNTLVTNQTGPDGKQVNKVLIAGAEEILNEFYLAVLLDRANSQPVIMVSTEGGMDIEEVAEKTPEKIVKEWVDPGLGLMPFQARKLAKALDLEGKLINQAVKMFTSVYKAWWKTDGALVEINPLCIVKKPDGSKSLAAVDTKVSFDDNALFRHKDIQELRDITEESPLEVEASKYDLNYIKLDGNIACLVNGAGLAMATMDIIQYYGGSPANFLDVGGGASKEQVTAAFKIILSDPNVKGILVNIFGGIMQCDIIASGILAAVEETGLELPLVVRLEGTNVAKGKKLISESNLDVISADSLSDAAEKIAHAVKNKS